MQYNGYEIWKMQVVWGKQHAVIFVPSEQNLFIFRDEIVILSMSEYSTTKQKNVFLKQSLKDELRREIEVLLPKWEQITNLKCSSWFIGKCKTAWGWCQPQTGRIMLNENLIYKPKQCLEYVILHELCHLLEANHEKKFAQLLNQYMPDWRDCEVLNNGEVAGYGKWE